MDLADRRRGERLPLERARRPTSGSPPSSLADDRADLVVAERRDLVEQPEQLVAVRDRQQVVAQGEHLAELHPRPAELLEREPHPDRVRVACRRPGGAGPGAMNRRKKTARTWPTRRGCRNRFLMRRSADRWPARARRGGAPRGRRTDAVSRRSSSNGTRRRRLGIAVSSSHSRPALTSSAKKCARPRVHEAHRALGGELALAAVVEAAAHGLVDHVLAIVEGLGQPPAA